MDNIADNMCSNIITWTNLSNIIGASAEEWCLSSPSAHKVELSYKNTILRFENYKKGFLPSLSFSLSPINFNRSQKLMQNSTNGNYSYVEDYSIVAIQE